MNENWKTLRSRFSYSFGSTPTDYGGYFEKKWNNVKNGTIMPPSPGVERIIADLEVVDDRVLYTLDVKWRDQAKWLFSQLDDFQLVHRSRVGTIAFQPLMVEENQRRTTRVAEWISEGEYSMYDKRASQLSEIYRMICQKTVEYLEMDVEWILHFIAAHKDSSVDRGLKWTGLSSMDMDEWKEFYDIVKTLAESFEGNEGNWLNLQYNAGFRARSNSVETPKLLKHYEGDLDRTRIVMFHPIMSSWNIFLPNKKMLYQEVIDETMKILGIPNQILNPYVEGGRYYSLWSELFKEGRPFKALDGKQWEAGVPSILGSAFNPHFTRLNGVSVLPSGVWSTSLLGTVASLVSLADSAGGDWIAGILGDDQSIIGKLNRNVRHVEEDLDDTKSKFILGMSYTNPDMPVVHGKKVQSDSAKLAQPMKLRYDKTETILLHGRHSVEETASWIGAYLGYFGSKTLIDAIQGIDFNEFDYLAPKVIFDYLTNNRSRDAGVSTHAWAENYGARVHKLIRSGSW